MPALKKARTVLFFQLFDLERNSRLRHEQGIGRAGEAQMLGYGMKDLQAPVSHGDSPLGEWSIFNHIPGRFRRVL